MVFIGMDHGTTGISFCLMSDEGKVIDVFKIGREESKKGLVSATEELAKRVDFEDVKLMAITYAMGDGGQGNFINQWCRQGYRRRNICFF